MKELIRAHALLCAFTFSACASTTSETPPTPEPTTAGGEESLVVPIDDEDDEDETAFIEPANDRAPETDEDEVGIDPPDGELVDEEPAIGERDDPEIDEGPAGEAIVDPEQEARERAMAAQLHRGRRAFDRVCSTCHNSGTSRLVGRAVSPAKVMHQVRNGGARMRPIPTSRLPNGELRAIIAFLQSRSGR